MDVLEILEKFGAPLITGVGGYLMGKPKAKADIDTINIDNTAKLMDRWKEIADNEKQRGQEHEKTITDLRDVISSLEGTISSLNIAIDSLSNDNNSYKIALEKIVNERDLLQKEVVKLEEIIKRKKDEVHLGITATLSDELQNN